MVQAFRASLKDSSPLLSIIIFLQFAWRFLLSADPSANRTVTIFGFSIWIVYFGVVSLPRNYRNLRSPNRPK